MIKTDMELIKSISLYKGTIGTVMIGAFLWYHFGFGAVFIFSGVVLVIVGFVDWLAE